jgi:hypothetical protein
VGAGAGFCGATTLGSGGDSVLTNEYVTKMTEVAAVAARTISQRFDPSSVDRGIAFISD